MITQPPMIGILCSRIRVEEKALFETLRRRAIPFERLDEDRIQFPIGNPFPNAPDVVLDRSIHHGRSLYALTLLNAAGVPTVNRARVARICAIYRSSDHWITNTARNGKASQMEVTPEIDQLCRKAATAVGGGFLSVDLLEHPDGLLVNEINYTPEFHGFMDATGIQVADHVVDYVTEIAAKPTAA